MAARFSEVVIQFHCPPHLMFPLPAGETLSCNRLTLRLQPNEGIRITFRPRPDAIVSASGPPIELRLRGRLRELAAAGAYERLILDAIQGDAALFMRSDEIERRGRSSTP